MLVSNQRNNKFPKVVVGKLYISLLEGASLDGVDDVDGFSDLLDIMNTDDVRSTHDARAIAFYSTPRTYQQAPTVPFTLSQATLQLLTAPMKRFREGPIYVVRELTRAIPE